MANLEEQIMQDLKEAMKAKDEAKLRTLRAIKSAILLEKTSGKSDEMSEEDELKMLNKLAKQRQDALAIYEKENRPELADKEREELVIIQSYMPEQLSDEELEKEVQSIIDEVGASSMADMGKVMGIASKKLLGKADGKSISDKVKTLLSQ